jgi:hypothetical protein
MKHTFAVTIDTNVSTFNEMLMDARLQLKRQLLELYMIKNEGSVWMTARDLKTHHGNVNRMVNELGIKRRGARVKVVRDSVPRG